jgi:hypothetical protein
MGTAKSIPIPINNIMKGKTAPPMFKSIFSWPYNLKYDMT